MSAMNTALLCAGPLPAHAKPIDGNAASMALMCIGLHPIPPTPASLRAEVVEPPKPKKKRKFGSVEDFGARRREAVRSRVNSVLTVLRTKGHSMTKTEIAAELGLNENTVLTYLNIHRERGDVVAKKSFRNWVYGAVNR